jgi:hypothetical protein
MFVAYGMIESMIISELSLGCPSCSARATCQPRTPFGKAPRRQTEDLTRQTESSRWPWRLALACYLNRATLGQRSTRHPRTRFDKLP